jgi:hypothetical protein
VEYPGKNLPSWCINFFLGIVFLGQPMVPVLGMAMVPLGMMENVTGCNLV